METTEPQYVIGYKAFNSYMKCNYFQYEVGKTYTMNENDVRLCVSGFHFCMIPIDVLLYYDKDSNFAIIKASGKIEHGYDKSVCSQITIEKLITLDELHQLTNGKFIRNNGTTEFYQYYQNGELHRLDGPAIEVNGNKYWYKDGELHREDGPAVEFANGSKEWHRDGKYYREDGPAMECANGTKIWFENGERHRLDGPAIEYANGGKEWFKNGKRHRLDGPAIEQADGHKEWFKDGERHREDGPAIEWANGTKEWYKNGMLIIEKI